MRDRKKRRVWWIVGSVVTVALFAAVAFLSGYNSTDARIDRAVAQLVEEYGSEFQSELPSFTLGWVQSDITTYLYSRASVDAKTAGEIVAILRKACSACEYEHVVSDEAHVPITASGGDPWMETHRFTSAEQDGNWTEGVLFAPYDKGFETPDHEADAYLYVYKFDRPSLWQRIKGLWPW